MKIEGFGGKLQLEGDGVKSVATSSSVVPASQKTSTKTEPPHSFKLKMAMAESKEDLREQQLGEAGKSEDHKIKAQSEFSGTDVASALEAFMGSLEEDTGIKIALTSRAPKVQGFVITLEVDNDFLLGKVTDLYPSLQAFLMKKLNNGFITLNVQVHAGEDEEQDKKRLFTSKDKFEHFIKLNPAVGELKALFGLEIE